MMTTDEKIAFIAEVLDDTIGEMLEREPTTMLKLLRRKLREGMENDTDK